MQQALQWGHQILARDKQFQKVLPERYKKNFYDRRKNLITIYRLTSVNPFHGSTLKENADGQILL